MDHAYHFSTRQISQAKVLLETFGPPARHSGVLCICVHLGEFLFTEMKKKSTEPSKSVENQSRGTYLNVSQVHCTHATCPIVVTSSCCSQSEELIIMTDRVQMP